MINCGYIRSNQVRNAEVGRLHSLGPARMQIHAKESLPDSARIGTVDKFQG
jgi:hypothetical protein